MIQTKRKTAAHPVLVIRKTPQEVDLVIYDPADSELPKNAFVLPPKAVATVSAYACQEWSWSDQYLSWWMPHGNVVLPDVVTTMSLSDLLFQKKKTTPNPKLGGFFFPVMISRQWYGLFSIKRRLMI